MHGVAAAVGTWLDAGEAPVVVRVPLAEGIGGAGPGEVLAFGPAGRRVGNLLGGAVDDVAARLADEVRATGQRHVESVQITNEAAAAHGLTCGGLVTVVADSAAALPFDWRVGRAPMVFAGPLGTGGPITSVTADDTTAGEVALAICAEVLAIRNGRPPLSLQATSGPIHR